MTNHTLVNIFSIAFIVLPMLVLLYTWADFQNTVNQLKEIDRRYKRSIRGY